VPALKDVTYVFVDAAGRRRRVQLWPCRRCGANDWAQRPDVAGLRCRRCGRYRSAPRELRTS
jgi:hypothetical protein